MIAKTRKPESKSIFKIYRKGNEKIVEAVRLLEGEKISRAKYIKILSMKQLEKDPMNDAWIDVAVELGNAIEKFGVIINSPNPPMAGNRREMTGGLRNIYGKRQRYSKIG